MINVLKTNLKIVSFFLLRKYLVVTLLSLLMLGCQSLKTAVFDQYSYQQAISIKVESLNLMDEATQSYNTYEMEVEALLLELQKMVEYEKNKPNNEVSYAMWNLIANKDKNLLAGFFRRWQEDKQLSEGFTREAKVQVAEALDLIIQYEAKKSRANESKILNFLGSN
ncbi:hypothetical protein [Psychroserpens burtonensis]|uniref:hypothetical protein n=1 Tax=Psychroserpens burtonensis TaxID=49278 RepID=UPI0012FAAD09|nr:hypothetical protein [Psychroserpens burtonensis]